MPKNRKPKRRRPASPKSPKPKNRNPNNRKRPEQPETPKPPAPFFQGAFKAGFPGWYVQSLPERVSLNSSNPYKGQQAARFEVRLGDKEPDTGSQRSEVSGPTFAAGDSIYVRDAIRVPRAYAFHGPWQLIDQLHETEWGGSPGIAIFLDEGRNISLSAGDGNPHYWHGPQLEYERWYEVVYHVYLAREASKGYVEVWLDGKQQTLDNGATKQFGETIQTGHTYLKTGIYRSLSSTGTSVVEHSGVAVSHSLASFLGS